MSDGLILTGPGPRAVVGIGAYRDRAPLVAALQNAFGLVAPAGPSFMESDGVRLSCVAPGRFVATADRGSQLLARLEAALAGLAAITDQSDLWLFFALSGPLVKEALGRLVPINLSPMTFPVGGVSLTRCGHLDVRVWHVDDQSYELAVARSFADDLRHDLEQVVAAR